MNAPYTLTYRGLDLEWEMVDPASVGFVRLFQREGSQWNPPPPAYRRMRVDPPAGQQERYGVLYTANTLATAALECRVLTPQVDDTFLIDSSAEQRYRVARYTFDSPALFLPLDGRNRATLGLDVLTRGLTASYAPYQQAALQIYERYGQVIHGLSWESFHRGQHGRAYGWFDHRKDGAGLRLTNALEFPRLADDPQWIELTRTPGVWRIEAPPIDDAPGEDD